MDMQCNMCISNEKTTKCGRRIRDSGEDSTSDVRITCTGEGRGDVCHITSFWRDTGRDRHHTTTTGGGRGRTYSTPWSQWGKWQIIWTRSINNENRCIQGWNIQLRKREGKEGNDWIQRSQNIHSRTFLYCICIGISWWNKIRILRFWKSIDRGTAQSCMMIWIWLFWNSWQFEKKVLQKDENMLDFHPNDLMQDQFLSRTGERRWGHFFLSTDDYS